MIIKAYSPYLLSHIKNQPAAARMIGGHGLFCLFITVKIKNYLLRLLRGLSTADDPRYFPADTGWALPMTRVTSPRTRGGCRADNPRYFSADTGWVPRR